MCNVSFGKHSELYTLWHLFGAKWTCYQGTHIDLTRWHTDQWRKLSTHWYGVWFSSFVAFLDGSQCQYPNIDQSVGSYSENQNIVQMSMIGLPQRTKILRRFSKIKAYTQNEMNVNSFSQIYSFRMDIFLRSYSCKCFFSFTVQGCLSPQSLYEWETNN